MVIGLRKTTESRRQNSGVVDWTAASRWALLGDPTSRSEKNFRVRGGIDPFFIIRLDMDKLPSSPKLL
jgi:hypothetical protein